MKKSKKVISLILAVIMIMSAVPMQIFAADEPIVERVEVADTTPISNYDIQSKGWSDRDKMPLYDIHYSLYRYDYKLYFSNGKIIDTREYISYDDLLLCGITDCYVSTYVSGPECQKAIDEGIPTVKVTVSVSMTKTSGEEVVEEFEVERIITDKIVKSIKLLGDIPVFFEQITYKYSFYDRQFEVEFYDGRKEVLTFDGDLGGISVYDIYSEEREEVDEITGEKIFYRDIKFDFIDGNYCAATERLDSPYEKIEIVDYKLDKEAQLQSIEYKVTYKDGKTIKNTKNFEESIDLVDVTISYSVVVDSIDGYPIRAQLNLSETDYTLELSAGYDVWNVRDIDEGETRDICKCICHKNGIMYLIAFFVIVYWRALSRNIYCDCGHKHY